MEAVLENLSQLLQKKEALGPLLAFIAGIFTSMTPCSLSTIPLIISVVGGTDGKNTKRAFRLSLIYAVGISVTFTIMGTMAAVAGNLLGMASSWWYLFLGVLMVLMALQTWEVIQLIPSTYLTGRNKKVGYVGALMAGILAGIFSSPCSTPVLVVLLAIVAEKGSIMGGMVLLLSYAIGNAVLSVAAGTGYSFTRKIVSNNRYGIFSAILKYGMGGILLLLGLYMFYNGF